MRFPNKMISETYAKALGKTFTWRPSSQLFVDETENSNYDYFALLWLRDNGYMTLLPLDSHSLTCKWKVC